MVELARRICDGREEVWSDVHAAHRGDPGADRLAPLTGKPLVQLGLHALARSSIERQRHQRTVQTDLRTAQNAQCSGTFHWRCSGKWSILVGALPGSRPVLPILLPATGET